MSKRIVASDENREAWLEARKGLVTASDVAAWLGKSPWANKDDVLREKLEGIERQMGPSSESSMRHGLISEAHNMDKASRMLGIPIVAYHYLVVNARWPKIGATLDGLALADYMVEPDPRFAKRGTKGQDTYGQVLETIEELKEVSGLLVCEMKSTDSHVFKRKGEPRDWIEAVPEHYLIQVQTQMWVMDLHHALLCAQLGAGSMTAYLVHRDPLFENELDAIQQEFHRVTDVGF